MLGITHFLQQYRTKSKGSIVSMISPTGNFLLPPDTHDTFWDLYCDTYVDQDLGLAEIQNHTHVPVLVDVDLKKEANEISALYDSKHVRRLVEIYQKILREITESLPDDNLYCFLLEKPAYLLKKGDKSFLKNGFHLHFPFVFLSRYDQEHHLLPRIRNECKRLAPAEMPSCTTPDNYIDRSYCRGAGIPWLLYGSRKDVNQMPYLVSSVFDPNGVPVDDWRSVLMSYHIYSMDHDQIPLDFANVDHHLPRIFSIMPYGREEYLFDVKSTLENVSSHVHGIKATIKKVGKTEKLEDLQYQVEKLLPLLSTTRASNYDDWMMVGWTLYNIFEGNEDGYEYWLQFSRKCPSLFDESKCFTEWQRMKRKNLTIGTLKFMARMDNPSKYSEVSKDFLRPFLEKCIKLDITHHDLAKALFQKYESEFVCASITNRLWFHFVDHHWKKDEEGVSLRSKISSELVEEYDKIALEVRKKLHVAGDEAEEKMYKSRLDKIDRLIKCLNSSPYKSNVMKEAMEVFYERDFLSKLDTDAYLIAFKNGVYNFKEKVFRAGRPDDYISVKMNINYLQHYSMDDPVIQDIEDYFAKIFPDETVRNYFLNISSEIFVGGNMHKIVQVWSGEGNNGKSITQQLFEKMLGPYSIKLPTSLIIGKRTQSSSACPELCRAGNGVRFAMLQEPDEKDIINVGILKELSGNDTFYARGLYKEGGEITPMFKLALICNKTPRLPYNDKAAWNRIRVIPFESTFSEEAPATEEEQLAQKVFPMDLQFVDKIPSMIEPLAWFLVERFKSRPKVIVEPAKVMYATQSYRQSNDIYHQFMEEHVVDKQGSFILSSDLYATFKDWFRESIPVQSIPPKHDVTDHFIKIWGEPTMWNGQKRWEDHCLRSDVATSL